MIVNLLGAAAVILYTPSIYTLYIPIVVAKRQRLHRHHRCWSVGWSVGRLVGLVGWVMWLVVRMEQLVVVSLLPPPCLPAWPLWDCLGCRRFGNLCLSFRVSEWKRAWRLFHSLTRKDKHWGKKYSLVTRNPCLKAKLCLYLTELKQKAS